MFAFTVFPFLPTHRPKALSSPSSKPLALRASRFRGATLRTRPFSQQTTRTYRQIQVPKCFSDPPEDGEDDEEDEEQAEIILIDPRTERTLSVGVEQMITDNGKTYVLCYPIDDPVSFARTSETNALDPVEDDVLVQSMFRTAEAVLADDHFVLKNTAYVLTTEDHGEYIDDDEDDEGNEDGEDEENEMEEQDQQGVEVIGEFLHDGVPHFVVRPMEPVLLVAEVLANGYRVLEGEDLDRVTPMIEALIENLDVATA